MAWAKNGTPVDVTVAQADMDITLDNSTKFIVSLYDVIGSGQYFSGHRLDGTGSGSTAYAWRRSINGAADSTSTSQNNMAHDTGNLTGGENEFGILYLINVATEEKLSISFSVANNAAGATNAPNRVDGVGKHAQTSTGVTAINVTDVTDTGQADVNSNHSVIGTD